MAAITLIGSGNTATTLGKALKQAGHQIIQVWSRDESHAQKLATSIGSRYTSDISQVTGEADIYLITVKDDAIEDVAAQLPVTGRIIAHTSGIRSKNILHSSTNSYGIFYPNVSMTKGVAVDLSSVLLMIEGSDSATIASLKELADTITGNAKIVDEKQRQSLHVAAVFANNFTNHMFVVAEQILQQNGLAFDDIRPMIAAHMHNLMQQSPSMLQTGPGVRHDHTAIESHMKLIEANKELQDIYTMMTQSIQEWSKKQA